MDPPHLTLDAAVYSEFRDARFNETSKIAQRIVNPEKIESGYAVRWSNGVHRAAKRAANPATVMLAVIASCGINRYSHGLPPCSTEC